MNMCHTQDVCSIAHVVPCSLAHCYCNERAFQGTPEASSWQTETVPGGAAGIFSVVQVLWQTSHTRFDRNKPILQCKFKGKSKLRQMWNGSSRILDASRRLADLKLYSWHVLNISSSLQQVCSLATRKKLLKAQACCRAGKARLVIRWRWCAADPFCSRWPSSLQAMPCGAWHACYDNMTDPCRILGLHGHRGGCKPGRRAWNLGSFRGAFFLRIGTNAVS